MYSYPNNWQHFPNVIWDIVWPYIFVFLLLKCIVSSLLYSYLSIMQLKPSYLFVRIPILLCTLKYVNSKPWGPFLCINHFMKYTLCQRKKKKSCETNVDIPTEFRTPRGAEFCIYLLTYWIAPLLSRRKLLLWFVQQMFLWLLQILHMEMVSHPDFGVFLAGLFFLSKI